MSASPSYNEMYSLILIMRGEIDALRKSIAVLQEQVASLQSSAPRGIPGLAPKARKR